ncbi:uncharacterized protein WCI35_028502, partial [Daubentonia madagascariensis]
AKLCTWFEQPRFSRLLQITHDAEQSPRSHGQPFSGRPRRHGQGQRQGRPAAEGGGRRASGGEAAEAGAGGRRRGAGGRGRRAASGQRRPRHPGGWRRRRLSMGIFSLKNAG